MKNEYVFAYSKLALAANMLYMSEECSVRKCLSDFEQAMIEFEKVVPQEERERIFRNQLIEFKNIYEGRRELLNESDLGGS